MPFPPLISPRFRSWTVAAMAFGVVLTGTLGAVVFHGSSTTLDTSIDGALRRGIGPELGRVLLGFSSPAISVAALGIVVVLAAVQRRWNLVVVAAVSPLLAIGLTEVVLKPAIGRLIGSPALHLVGSYPSGHETGVTATGLVLVVACGQLSIPRSVRAGVRVSVSIGVVLWAVVAAVGLVREHLHYPTDTLGSVGVSTLAVLGTALVIDRISSPAARSLPSTSRAA